MLFVLFLVNLPIVSQALAARSLDRDGREVVAAVLDSSTRGGHRYLDYRLPDSVDPKGTRYSAEVDAATFASARATQQLSVRVVPDEPTNQRAAGTSSSATFLVVAVLGDTVLLAIALLGYRRHRRWNVFEVLAVQPGAVTVRGGPGTLTAAAPEAWTARTRVGDRVSGGFHLVVDEDLFPGPALTGLEQEHDVVHTAHGRVVDTRAGWVVLEMADGWRLRVETGPHRIRADIRDSTAARGVLCFTPGRLTRS